MIIEWVILVIGFIFLVKGADLLVDGASSLATRLGVSSLMVGLTVVAFGTSLPELIVNIYSVMSGSTDMSLGNIIGSNIANILLVLGIAGCVGGPLIIKKQTTWKEIPFSFLSAVVIFILLIDFFITGEPSILSRADGLILLCFFAVFMYYIASIAIKDIQKEKQNKHQRELESENNTKEGNILKQIVLILIGIVGLYFGGKMIVDSAITISRSMGISEVMISATVLALGTSLPEVVTSIIAVFKKKADLAVGNVIGSNIFNTFFVLGITSIIGVLPFNNVLVFDILYLIGVNIILFMFMFTGKYRKLDKWEAWVLIGLYWFYTTYLIIRG